MEERRADVDFTVGPARSTGRSVGTRSTVRESGQSGGRYCLGSVGQLRASDQYGPVLAGGGGGGALMAHLQPTVADSLPS